MTTINLNNATKETLTMLQRIKEEVKTVVSVQFVLVNDKEVYPQITFEYKDNVEMFGHYDYCLSHEDLVPFMNEYGGTSTEEIVERFNNFLNN